MKSSKFMKTWIGRPLFRGLSIQKRLPLLICILLLSIIISFTWISFLGLKETSLNNGKEKLRVWADQLSSMYAQSAQSLITATHAAAAEQPVKEFLRSGGTLSGNEAAALLKK